MLVAPDENQSTAETPETVGSLALENNIPQNGNDVNNQQPTDDTFIDTANTFNKKIIKGRKNSVKTAKGTKVDTVFALVDSRYVIASHTESGSENPKYDQSLQPRDRSRKDSIMWVQKNRQ